MVPGRDPQYFAIMSVPLQYDQNALLHGGQQTPVLPTERWWDRLLAEPLAGTKTSDISVMSRDKYITTPGSCEKQESHSLIYILLHTGSQKPVTSTISSFVYFG